MKTLCIYHENCVDGIVAAWVVYHALSIVGGWNDVEYLAASYGDSPPTVGKDTDVVIVDFSYPLDDLTLLADEARSVLVLDHHKTAEEDLANLPRLPDGCGTERWFAHTEIFPTRGSSNIAVVFDQERSGAGLTWDYFHPGKDRPDLVSCVEDRDLWRFKRIETKPVHAWLTSHDWRARVTIAGVKVPAVFFLLDGVSWCNGHDARWLSALVEGEAILRSRRQTVEGILATSTMRRSFLVGDRQYLEIPIVNAPGEFASEACDVLNHRYPDAPFVATYYDSSRDTRIWSLRSRPDGIDVSAIARSFGGGGHAHAAGYRQIID